MLLYTVYKEPAPATGESNKREIMLSGDEVLLVCFVFSPVFFSLRLCTLVGL